MTTESDPSQASEKPWGKYRNHMDQNDYFAWAKTPGINPMKVAAVVAGFAIFPPLGGAALLYFLWKSRRHGWHGNAYAMAGGAPEEAGDIGHRHRCGGWRGRHHGRGYRRWTGNAAFDQHQAEAIEKLRAEREAFWAFRAEERRKRDQDAYDAFRARQQSPDVKPEGNAGDSQ